jgi:hypothetical protein
MRAVKSSRFSVDTGCERLVLGGTTSEGGKNVVSSTFTNVLLHIVNV